MKYARKKPKIVTAYQLGAGTPMEEALIQEGVIQRLPNGGYALFSQEAVNGTGEAACPGDYFKVDTVDGRRYPYPNKRAFFEANHRLIEGDIYEQCGRSAAVWQDGDGPCEEMEFLLNTGRLVLRPEDEARYFNAVLLDAPLSAARDAAVVFERVERDRQGRIADAVFSFVTRRDFERDFELLDAP